MAIQSRDRVDEGRLDGYVYRYTTGENGPISDAEYQERLALERKHDPSTLSVSDYEAIAEAHRLALAARIERDKALLDKPATEYDDKESASAH